MSGKLPPNLGQVFEYEMNEFDDHTITLNSSVEHLRNDKRVKGMCVHQECHVLLPPSTVHGTVLAHMHTCI